MAHYPPIAGYIGARKIYQKFHWQFYWPSMVFSFYDTVKAWAPYAKQFVILQSNYRLLKLFHASGALEDVAMNLLMKPIPTGRGMHEPYPLKLLMLTKLEEHIGRVHQTFKKAEPRYTRNLYRRLRRRRIDI